MQRLRKGATYALMTVGAFFIFVTLAVYASVTFLPDTHISQRILRAVEPITDEVPFSPDIYTAFRTTLQNEVEREIGTPQGGFEPYMFLAVFPGLSETDFEGARASIGQYTVENGRLVHKLDDSKLIHPAAKALTDQGMDTLLRNVSNRLKVDLAQGGTLTKIMNALVANLKGVEPVLEEPIACTMDAKICPDGSAVGRIGPRCEFAPCP